MKRKLLIHKTLLFPLQMPSNKQIQFALQNKAHQLEQQRLKVKIQQGHVTTKEEKQSQVDFFLRNSLEPRVQIQYSAQIHKFKAWTKAEGIAWKAPMSEQVLTDYIVSEGTRSGSFNVVKQALTAIKFWHKSNGQAMPDIARLEQAMKGINKVSYKEPRQAKIISQKDFLKVAAHLLDKDGIYKPLVKGAQYQNNPRQWGLAATLVLTYFCTARFSDLQGLDFGDVRQITDEVEGDIIQLVFKKGKTNKTSQASTSTIVSNQDGFCVVNFLMRYKQMLCRTQKEPYTGRVLPAMVRAGGRKWKPDPQRPIPYTTASRGVKTAGAEIGIDITLHSGRRSSATHLAQATYEQKLPNADSIVRAAGRWAASSHTMGSYVDTAQAKSRHQSC